MPVRLNEGELNESGITNLATSGFSGKGCDGGGAGGCENGEVEFT